MRTVGEILVTVNAVAKQSNLLAINAAIEEWEKSFPQWPDLPMTQ
jgi:hypothetical protein